MNGTQTQVRCAAAVEPNEQRTGRTVRNGQVVTVGKGGGGSVMEQSVARMGTNR